MRSRAALGRYVPVISTLEAIGDGDVYRSVAAAVAALRRDPA